MAKSKVAFHVKDCWFAPVTDFTLVDVLECLGCTTEFIDEADVFESMHRSLSEDGFDDGDEYITYEVEVKVRELKRYRVSSHTVLEEVK